MAAEPGVTMGCREKDTKNIGIVSGSFHAESSPRSRGPNALSAPARVPACRGGAHRTELVGPQRVGPRDRPRPAGPAGARARRRGGDPVRAEAASGAIATRGPG